MAVEEWPGHSLVDWELKVTCSLVNVQYNLVGENSSQEDVRGCDIKTSCMR